MTEEEFLEAVTPLPEHDYFSFCPSDGSLGSNNSFTRVYINFKSQGDIFTFRDKFDGYVFVDKKGKCKDDWANVPLFTIFICVKDAMKFFPTGSLGSL